MPSFKFTLAGPGPMLVVGSPVRRRRPRRWLELHRLPHERVGPTRSPRVKVADLRWFFRYGENAGGLTSFFRVVVDHGRAGVAVRRMDLMRTENARAQLLDRRTDGERTGARHRRVWGALRALPSEQVSVLSAAYAPADWPRLVQRHYGDGAADVLREYLGSLLGVALLTATARSGARVDGDQDAGAWLVRAARVGNTDALLAAKADAGALLRKARMAASRVRAGDIRQ